MWWRLGARGLVLAAAPVLPPGPVAHPAAPSPARIVGVTVDDVSHVHRIVLGARSLSTRPTTRVYFDVKRSAASYRRAVEALHPDSDLLGELLDSSDEKRISVGELDARVTSYLQTLGSDVDIWEIGNEVNGNWTAPYDDVAAKLTAAYDDVSAAGGVTALTLYYNVGCGDGRGELSPLEFTDRYVPAAVRDGLDYVFLSYYEGACRDRRPSRATWTSYFEQLHARYPNARVGFGEIGLTKPVSQRTLAQGRSMMRHYYQLGIGHPYFVGGYFWWYYAEDCLPYDRQPLWRLLDSVATG